MRFSKLISAAFVTLALLGSATISFGQNQPQTSVEIPPEKIAEKAKPLLGHWYGLSCQQNQPLLVNVQIDLPKPTENPVFTLLGFYTADGGEQPITLAFETRDFIEVTATDKPWISLDVENGNMLLSIYPQKNGTLYGDVLTASGDEFEVFFATANGSQADFFQRHAGVCTDETQKKNWPAVSTPNNTI